MASTNNKRVLVAGMKQAPDPETHEEWTPEKTKEAIQKEVATARSNGFDLDNYMIDPSKGEEKLLDEFRQMLKSKQWDGVSIGFGVRGPEEHTPLFEKLVNAIAEEVHPTPKFIFALRPHLVWEAVSRVFGVDGQK